MLSDATEPKAIAPRISRALWCILALMVVSVAINYIDRGSLSTAAPLLKADMAIPPAQLGLLLSAFFWTYALLQVASGSLVDRFDVKWVMAIGFLIWSLATAATGLARSFSDLLLSITASIEMSATCPPISDRKAPLADGRNHS